MIRQSFYIVKESFKTIPFVEVIFHYTENFTNSFDLGLTQLVKDKLEYKLLEELSSVAEVTLQSELDDFIDKGGSDFDEFIERINLSLAIIYPVLDKLLKLKVTNFLNHICNIISRFKEDSESIKATFNIDSSKIIDIDVCLGDGHNGEGTALVYLSNGTKLIYKPRNIGITNSYNFFIEWVNFKLKTNIKTFKVLDCKSYGWIEFVNYEQVNSEDDLQEYYYKAGILLAVTLLLGSKDCHHENVIASGSNPFMIDHETIIQPFFNDQSFRTWDVQHQIPPFSVLESFLIVNQNTGLPSDIVGYGVNGNIEVIDLEKKVINPNTINSKRTTRFATRKIVDKNIPKLNGTYTFANDYKEHFICGFTKAYDMFLGSKNELKSDSSPLQLFKKNEVRYVWRPTFVYFKILKYMRSASFMSSHEVYQSKLYDLLSKAFKGENRQDFKFILDFEISQMLNGEIPIFSLQCMDNFLEGNESLRLFQYNCLQNILHRVDLLSSAHKNEQLTYINRWLES
ncbi:type 2 lanthipeptide synthetase LanM [Spirosoma oryzicola]|uniref:type 2 lanthipeptide synthetase LanM n=1 Tax=Spirosoma oryzicola TaxID=2898794 RepID=UPI001E531727|nr:type 2 lanthipeptide synthetase LanM [Spirosoma oryzicola]UHG94879.1 type 2 lantipeptide synthetase LanM [Spirosoma oryzicola]